MEQASDADTSKGPEINSGSGVPRDNDVQEPVRTSQNFYQ